MKKLQIIFLAACMLVCLVPFVGMAFHPTKDSTENRRLSEFPSATAKDGGLNLDFFKEFDTWFNEHFAFRNELVAADGMIQGTIFKTSAEEQVIYGTDDWLYYSSTLGNYQGTNCMDERERFNLQHNLEIVSDWAKEKGVELLLTVPPNKNTLYGEHMPYYDAMIVNPFHTLDYMPEICKASETHYADLAKLFRNEEETLYLKRDSHWNGKGALLAYNRIMEKSYVLLNSKYLSGNVPPLTDVDISYEDKSYVLMDPKNLGGNDQPFTDEDISYEDKKNMEMKYESSVWTYEDYASAPATRAKETDGDLNRMLYTYYGEKEMDTYYKVDQNFSYVTATESVEDAWIETRAEGKKKTLLMFRDSFGNTLIPYVANQFGKATFSKESPYRLEKLVAEQRPDLIIMEKVERNLRDYITQPPIVEAPEVLYKPEESDKPEGTDKTGEQYTPEESDKPEGTDKSGEQYTPDNQDITGKKDLQKMPDISQGELIDAEALEMKVETNPYDPSMVQISGTVPDERISTETEIILSVNGTFYRTFHTEKSGFVVYLGNEKVSGDSCHVQVILSDDGKYQMISETTLSF